MSNKIQVEREYVFVREFQKGTASEYVILPIGKETEKAIGLDTGARLIWLPKSRSKPVIYLKPSKKTT